MVKRNFLRTAECVTPKHPDKLCDQISDAILDFCLMQDRNSRVAVETLGGHGKIVVMGEVTFDGILEDKDIYKIIERITGYSKKQVSINIVKQSKEISRGVDTGGAGDQGIMIGYACKGNPELVPQEYYLARNLCRFLYIHKGYSYDGKTQITLNENNDISTIVASFQKVSAEGLRNAIEEWLKFIFPTSKAAINLQIFCNPAGNWTQGGFDADTGLTGRKLMVDNYGPQVSIGGGAFSGKDATKVDRSGAYMAHKIARDLLRSENANEVLVKLAYSIGVSEPVMAIADVDGKIITLDAERLTPSDIIRILKLKEPQFEETAKWGHFGNGFTWDK